MPVALIDSGRATFAQLAEPDFDRVKVEAIKQAIQAPEQGQRGMAERDQQRRILQVAEPLENLPCADRGSVRNTGG